MAQYPTTAATFTTKQDGQGQYVFAAHMNAVQTEITALTTALLTTGLAHHLTPDVDSTRDLGTASKAFRHLYVDTVNYTTIVPAAGTIATGVLGTGTPDTTTYLRGDGSWAAAMGTARYSQTFTDLTNTPVNMTGVFLAKVFAVVRIQAPSTDVATFLVTARGGQGVGWVAGWTGAAGHTASNTLAFTMAGSAAEDYTFTIASGSGQLAVQKTSAGTLTGNTTIIVHIFQF